MRRELPDYLRPGLRLVFVGFNPGERSSRIGHYYAGRGNQFWNFLYESGLVPQRLGPEDDARLLEFGLGLTDVVKRWSRSSSELRAADYRRGVPVLAQKLRASAPRVVAFNGKLAYERFSGRRARLGWQRTRIAGARVFVLPSTSGRNGSRTRTAKLAYFQRLARWLQRNVPWPASRRLELDPGRNGPPCGGPRNGESEECSVPSERRPHRLFTGHTLGDGCRGGEEG
jgi:TDG/mug DNA glycosylase family protein